MPHEDYCYALERENHALNEKYESLRQQLDGWIAANSPNGWIDNLRQQLSDHIKREMMLRGFVKLLRDYIPASAVGNMTVQEALAATADLDGLILCHAEPVGFEYRCVKLPAVYFLEKTGSAAGYKGEWTKTKLYRAWDPK